MAYFGVMLGGTGINITSEEGGPSITGFFTTRLVRAETAAEAEKKAKAMIISEWTSGEYSEVNTGLIPLLSIEKTFESSFWKYLRFKNRGYTFYAPDEESSDESA